MGLSAAGMSDAPTILRPRFASRTLFAERHQAIQGEKATGFVAGPDRHEHKEGG